MKKLLLLGIALLLVVSMVSFVSAWIYQPGDYGSQNSYSGSFPVINQQKCAVARIGSYQTECLTATRACDCDENPERKNNPNVPRWIWNCYDCSDVCVETIDDGCKSGYFSCYGNDPCPPSMTCENNKCVAKTPTSNNNPNKCDFNNNAPMTLINPDCPSDKPHCAPYGSNNQYICVQCIEDKNCGNGKICDLSNNLGTCVKANSPNPVTSKLTIAQVDDGNNVILTFTITGCTDLEGIVKSDKGNSVKINKQGSATSTIKKPDVDKGDLVLQYTYESNDKSCKGTGSVTIKANDECGNEFHLYVPGKTDQCKCEGKVYADGACCYGKYERFDKNKKKITTPEQCSNKKQVENINGNIIKLLPCPKSPELISVANKGYENGCNCNGKNYYTSSSGAPNSANINGMVCCKSGNIATSPSACPPEPCDKKCTNTNKISNEEDKCQCPSYCSNPGIIKFDSKDKTCGAYKPNSMCIRYGDCMTPAVCKERKGTEEPNYLDSCKEKGSICCTFKGDNQTTELFRCTDVCKDVNGCTCPGNCKDKNGDPVHNALKGNTCTGVFSESNEANSACSGFDRESKDNVCPPGCFWFNDFDCGVDKNIGNVLWDFVKKGDWLNWYTKDYQNFMRDLGAKFDIMTWAESICNPMNSVSPSRKDFEDGELISTNKLVGWIGAESSQYNTSTSVYTISWFLANLPKDNWYRIELSSSSETFNIPNYMYEPVNGSLIVFNDSNTLWYNISAGTTHSGENTNIVLLDSRIFTRICIKFKKPVDYKTPNQLNIQKISEVCRDINQARKE